MTEDWHRHYEVVNKPDVTSLHLAGGRSWGGRAQTTPVAPTVMYSPLDTKLIEEMWERMSFPLRPRKDPWVEFWGEMDADKGPVMSVEAMEKEIGRLRGLLDVKNQMDKDMVRITQDQAQAGRDMVLLWKALSEAPVDGQRWSERRDAWLQMDAAVTKFESDSIGEKRSQLEARLALVQLLHETED